MQSRLASALGTAIGVLLFAFVLAPIVIVILISVTDQPYVSLPRHGISWRHYAELLENPKWAISLLNSLIVSAGATLIATVLGTLCAIGAWQVRTWWGRYLQAAMLLPLIVPVVVQAVGLYRLYIPAGLIDTFPGIIIGQAILGIPYVVIATSAVLSNVDRRIDQASRSLGATPLQTTWRVLIPAARPGVLSGALICFVFCFDEVVLTVFLTGLRTPLLPKVVWDGLQDDMRPVIAAACTTLLFAILAVMLARLWAGRLPALRKPGR